jgi:hypothetical protein
LEKWLEAIKGIVYQESSRPGAIMASAGLQCPFNFCRSNGKKSQPLPTQMAIGAPPGLSRAALYSKCANSLYIPLSSVVEEYKVGKVRALITLKESQDQKISAAEPEVRTGEKWSAKEA